MESKIPKYVRQFDLETIKTLAKKIRKLKAKKQQIPVKGKEKIRGKSGEKSRRNNRIRPAG